MDEDAVVGLDLVWKQAGEGKNSHARRFQSVVGQTVALKVSGFSAENNSMGHLALDFHTILTMY
jgi:hypothetical protein